ncbi:MAG: glycosyltransferase [Candidatus Magasanikbacteria bacterium]|nr:glycosyltransferase [Candidatus Magasanikbacteria bacterium]
MELRQKQTILYIITQGHWGGAQTYLYELATGLNRRYNIHIAVGESLDTPDLQKKIQTFNQGESAQNQISCISLKHLVRPVSPAQDILAIFEMAKCIKTCEPDIIHLNSSKAGVLGSISALFYRNPSKRVIYTVHGWVFNEALGKTKKYLYKILEKLSAAFKTHIILLTKKDFSIVLNLLGISKNKLRLIPLGASVQNHILTKQEAKTQINAYLPSNKKILQDTFTIGIIANLYHNKGIDIHLRALGLLSKTEIQNTKTIIIGDGPERARLLKLSEDLHIKDFVHFLGFIDKASCLLPAFDLCIIPSRKEGSPYILKEAIIQNIPVLSSKVGDVEEYIIHKKTGLLAEPGNTDEWAAHIVWSLHNRQQLSSFSASNQKNIPSVDEMLKKTIEVYGTV